MKSTSKKSTGLLGGFDFQPIFSEQTLSRSEPKEEEVSQTKPSEAEQAQIKPNEATDSRTQPNNAIVSESKPKKLKQAKEVQRLIEQGDVHGALAEAGLTKKKIPMPESHQGVASGDGKRSKRITILMSEEERKYINREARRHGMTIGQFVYALAVAAAEGKIELIGGFLGGLKGGSKAERPAVSHLVVLGVDFCTDI